MKSNERPLSAVSPGVMGLLAALIALQIGWKSAHVPSPPKANDLPMPPSELALRIAALGEPEMLARMLMLYLQAFDFNANNTLAYRNLDYTRLSDWLWAILRLDPKSQYPLFAAARIYAEVPDAARQRQMLSFIHQRFLDDPDRRWPWLAHAALVAKHRLKDLPLARAYAADLQRLAKGKDVPLWARQMEIFILEDMNEFEAARIMLGGMLAAGRIEDPGERRFLEQRLKALEAREKGLSQRP